MNVCFSVFLVADGDGASVAAPDDQGGERLAERAFDFCNSHAFLLNKTAVEAQLCGIREAPPVILQT